jgi:aspartyl-tRNA(Asn)/glutamyl-tRNA(Gln) amidotransferase subunit C
MPVAVACWAEAGVATIRVAASAARETEKRILVPHFEKSSTMGRMRSGYQKALKGWGFTRFNLVRQHCWARPAIAGMQSVSRKGIANLDRWHFRFACTEAPGEPVALTAGFPRPERSRLPLELAAAIRARIMSVTNEQVRHIARLARIAMSDDELERLVPELNNILGWVEQLGEVNTDGVEPLTAVIDQKLRLRDDIVTEGDIRDEILANAPEAQHGFFAVPKVIE